MTKSDTQRDMFEFERQARHGQPGLVVCGVDEAGRGPLAGPVVVAAVILPDDFELAVYDSKAFSEDDRESLALEIKGDSRIIWKLAVRSAGEIDRYNILRATHQAMREAVQQLEPEPQLALVDGLKVPDFPVPAQFIVKGDTRSASIATASILAKTHRDELMRKLDQEYPAYGFAQHKGYGTQAHLDALRKFGPCPEHRRTFAPVAAIIHPPPVQLELFN